MKINCLRDSEPMFSRLSFKLLALTCFLSVAGNAQKSRNVPALQDTISITDTASRIEATLVGLALKSPRYDISEHQHNVAELGVKTAKNSWFNLLSISTNYNDQSFSKKDPTTPNIYPKYFLGVTIPLGVIFTKGSEVKTAKEAVKISEQNQEQLKRAIRTDILAMYKQYMANVELLRLQNELVIDEQALYLQTEKKYSENKVTIETYNTASKNYNASLVSRVNLQLQQEILKLNIEQVIGMKLEDALKLALQPKN